MAKLFVMIGAPATGKTTFAQENLAHALFVSRDAIRFSLLKEGESYFDHEDEVFKIFISEIAEGLKLEQDVVADATHIDKASRKKLFRALKKEFIKIGIPDIKYEKIAVSISASSEIAIKRNAERIGLTKVPNEVITRMFMHFEAPKTTEGFDQIWHIRTCK